MGYLVGAPGIAGGDKKRAVDLAGAMIKGNAARGYLLQAQIAGNESGMPPPSFKKPSMPIRATMTRAGLWRRTMWGRVTIWRKPSGMRGRRSRRIRTVPVAIAFLAGMLASQNRLDESAAIGVLWVGSAKAEND